MTDEDEPVIRLVRWPGPWEDDDPHANLKADVALYSRLDPLKTLKGLSGNVGLPVGALARYVLARYATSGSGGLLEVGPSMVHRLWEPIEVAEDTGTDVARLAAYDQLDAARRSRTADVAEVVEPQREHPRGVPVSRTLGSGGSLGKTHAATDFALA
jgi:hypothetical protein